MQHFEWVQIDTLAGMRDARYSLDDKTTTCLRSPDSQFIQGTINSRKNMQVRDQVNLHETDNRQRCVKFQAT